MAQKKLAARKPVAKKSVAVAPLTPGPVQATADASQLSLSNGVLALTWRIDAGRLHAVALQDKRNARSIAMAETLFTLQVVGGKTLNSNDFHVVGAPRAVMLVGDGSMSRLADRFDGKELLVELEDSAKTLHLSWRAILREGSAYVRQEMNIQPLTTDLAPFVLRMNAANLPGADSKNLQSGALVFGDNAFFGYEDVDSTCELQGSVVTCGIKTNLPIGKGVISPNFASVIGVSAAGQLRREWNQYLLRERVHSFTPQLIVRLAPSKFDEASLIEAVKTIGGELANRQVVAGAYVIGDGWQDKTKPMQLSATFFPKGLTALAAAAESVQSELGFHIDAPSVTLSDAAEIKAFKAQKLIGADNRLRLSNPNYFNYFRSAVMKLAKGGKAVYLELDNAGGNDAPAAGSYVDSDKAAWQMLAAELRSQNADLMISNRLRATASAWSLWSADAVTESANESVLPSVYASLSLDGRDAQFAANLHAAVASMHGWLELTIDPKLLKAEDYDAIAESFIWQRDNASMLADAHTLVDAKAPVIVRAAWSPTKAALWLSNPTDQPQTIQLDLAKAFELPVGDKTKSYALHSLWRADKASVQRIIKLGAPAAFTLKPGESLLWEATPQLK